MAQQTFAADEVLAEDRAIELSAELGLARDEYDRIVETLGRVPTTSELGMYSVMWSEHCSYKSSRRHLGTLPTDGERVLAGPGENAGVVDVGDGIAITFKIESHNHPSFVEPYQGAATGVGGIIRDILTMGARPIAVMDALRFGPLDDAHPDVERTRRIVDGVVRGISGYGNCVGVANIGGEVEFDAVYAGNPLVNALAIGVLRHDQLQSATAEDPGDIAIILGSATGRDGIGGASVLASAEFAEGDDDKRPNVQIGDPFEEKLLIECCLELFDSGLVAGIQDMGAAGIACSLSELASAASLGMVADLDKVHLRGESLESWEILCSETQERMLALAKPAQVEAVLAVANKHGVEASIIGEVAEGDNLTLTRDGELIADLPARSLADEGPVYDRPFTRPQWQDGLAAMAPLDIPDSPQELAAFVTRFMASPNNASSRWITEQYDHLVGGGTRLGPGKADAGVIRLPGTNRAVACATDGNGRWCYLDPREGTRRVVAEAFRNVAVAGAEPIAVTNNLNFGNPERPEIMWQLVEAIGGLGDACRALDVPVTGGNVSLYNETSGVAIYPTPVIGILGLLEDVGYAVGATAGPAGTEIYLLSPPAAPTHGDPCAGSELQRFVGQDPSGTLTPVDLAHERRLAGFLAEQARAHHLVGAHDVSRGGLVAALGDLVTDTTGIVVHKNPTPDMDLRDALFGEDPGRVLLALEPETAHAVADAAAAAGLRCEHLATVGGAALDLWGAVSIATQQLVDARQNGLERAIGGSH